MVHPGEQCSLRGVAARGTYSVHISEEHFHRELQKTYPNQSEQERNFIGSHEKESKGSPGASGEA